MSPLIDGVADKHLETTKFSQLTDAQKDRLINNYGSKSDARDAWKGARNEWATQNSSSSSGSSGGGSSSSGSSSGSSSSSGGAGGGGGGGGGSKPAPQLVGTKYRDMSDAYRDRVSKEEYKERRNEQRMAGDHIGVSGQDAGTYRSGLLDIDQLEDYNRRAIGAGGSVGGKKRGYDDGGTPDDFSDDTLGKGVDRLSKIDLKLLLDSNANWLGQASLSEGEEGYLPDDLRAKQELINYSKVAVDDEGAKQGGAAQRLLGKWANEIANYEYVPPTNDEPVAPVDPVTPVDPVDPGPVDPVEPVNPGPVDPVTPVTPTPNPPPTVIISDPITVEDVSGGSTIGIVDINNTIEQTMDQDAIATINMGDVDLSVNDNVLDNGSQINIDASQTAGDAIATNNGTQTATITNNVSQQFNPYTGAYELKLGGTNLADNLRDQIFASYGA